MGETAGRDPRGHGGLPERRYRIATPVVERGARPRAPVAPRAATRSHRPASMHDGDLAWFESEGRDSSEELPPDRSGGVMHRIGVALVAVLGAAYLLAGITLAGCLVGRDWVHMTVAASLCVLFPLLLWWWLRSRYFRPRLTVLVLVLNTVFVTTTIAVAPGMAGRAIEAHGIWWLVGVARAVGAQDTALVTGGERLMGCLARTLRGGPAAPPAASVPSREHPR